MGRWKAWALAWLLAAILSALLLQAPSAHADELLVNGGFENELAGEWYTTSGDDVIERLCRPDIEVHGDECAGRVTCHGPQKCEVSQTVLEVGYGEYYELQGYVARNDDGPATLAELHWYESSDGTGPPVDWPGGPILCTEAGDEPYDCLITVAQWAPPSARSARVKVLAADPSEGFIMYLDDFSFTGPAAPTPTPSPTPSPSPTHTPPPTASPSPSPGPTASPTPRPVASPSPAAVPTATKVPSVVTPSPSTPTPSVALVNGGFEEADGEGKPLGWRKWGGELSRSSPAAWEGQFAAAFTSRTTSTKWAYQTLTVQGGATYVLSGYALKNDANVAAAYLRLSWYASSDGSGRLIDSVDSTTRLTDDSPEFRFLTSGPVPAPAEAASAKVRLMLDPVSETEGTVYFDAISFLETTMPLEPVETPQPSPALASSESPAASAVAPAASPAEPGPSSSPNSASPSPTVLGATSGAPKPTVSSLNGPSQSKTVSQGSPTRTPVVLYREQRGDQSIQAEGRVAMGSDEGDGFSLTVLVLAMALPAVAVAAIGSFVWRRWRKRARPP
jgi:hypothetical protein